MNTERICWIFNSFSIGVIQELFQLTFELCIKSCPTPRSVAIRNGEKSDGLESAFQPRNAQLIDRRCCFHYGEKLKFLAFATI